MRILIAEDEPVSRTALAGVLRRKGHEVVVAVNGAEAWHELQQASAPALAVLDWMMPEMDGLEVVRHVRALEAGRPPCYFIMLTSLDGKAEVIAALEAGANDYVAKPFDPGELCARIEVGRRLIEMQNALADKIAELRDAADQIRTLRGIIPICSGCKSIRDDRGYWSQVEAYVSKHSEAKFTHGLCPKCVPKYFPDIHLDP